MTADETIEHDESASEPVSPPAGGEVRVTLKQPHRHRGRDCAAGETITVRADQVRFLKSNNIIE